MKDIYNEMSSSSDEEDSKQTTPSESESPKPRKKDYTAEDMQEDLEKMEQRKAAKMADDTLKEFFGEDYESQMKQEEDKFNQ